MKFHSLVIDNFFKDGQAVRNALMNCEFKDVVSPFDQVTYPGIAVDLPEMITGGLKGGIEGYLGPITPTATFARVSPSGNFAPHQAHSDWVMGQYTALVYMNLPHQCVGGTSILRHKNGMEVQPRDVDGNEILIRDSNKPELWDVVGLCEMKFNRLFLVDSTLIHRSEPVGGFGKTLLDGRLVLVMFFNLV